MIPHNHGIIQRYEHGNEMTYMWNTAVMGIFKDATIQQNDRTQHRIGET